ncbi:MAG TPA: RraA family protein [Pyrinomonadaceae bacterium]|jgi:regulator of RNase E activity RraA
MELTDAIIDKIKRNRISTTEVADCLDKTGALPDALPLNRGHFRVGRVFWAYAYNESNWEFHDQIRGVSEGDVVVAEPFGCGDRAIYGELVSKFLLLYRQAAALVTLGKLRDVPHLIKENWPVWCQGATPIGCFNRRNEVPFDEETLRQRRRAYDGAIAVCDDSGVVVIDRDAQTEELLRRLDWIEEQEDIWFDCLDRRKWDTFDIVCLKRYAGEGE